MPKFLVLYRSTMSAREQVMSMSPEQTKSTMEAWMAWALKTGAALVDLGAPMGESAVLQGPPATGHVSGHSFVRADSMDKAKALFKGHPHFEMPGASIEIIEVLPPPGS